MRNLLILIFLSAFISSCKTETPKNENASAPQKTETSQTNQTNLVSLEYTVNPESVKANEAAEFTLELKDGNNQTIKDLEIVHEMPMHLLVVSEDLSEFYHLHPELQTDGKLKVGFTFPNGGYYRIYADFKPKGSEQMVKDFTQIVVGKEREKVPLKVDEKLEKTVEGLRVVMNSDAALENGKDAMLNFQVFDSATNKPVTDLENYLGEKAHFVIVSEDLKDFVHAHPMSGDNVKNEQHSHAENSEHAHDEKMSGADSQSIVSAHVAFPNAAKYKIWAQFKRAGKVITVPFVVQVKQGKSEKLLTEAKIPEGAYKIVVSKDGFAPQEISIKKGQAVKLAFVRLDDENCGGEIVLNDLNIRKKLPVGEVVTVDIPNDKTGEINFACGMNMFKGKIVIE